MNKNQIKFWYEKFEQLSSEIDSLQDINKTVTKRIEQVSLDITQVAIKLKILKEQSIKMDFDKIQTESIEEILK